MSHLIISKKNEVFLQVKAEPHIYVVVVKTFNLDYNFYPIGVIILKLHTFVLHYKGYNQTKGYNSPKPFDRILYALFRLRD